MRTRWIAVAFVWSLVVALSMPRLAQAEDPPRPPPPPVAVPMPGPVPSPAPVPTPAPTPAPALLGVEVNLTTLVEAVARKTGLLFGWVASDRQMRDRPLRLTRDLAAQGGLGLDELRRVLSANDMVLIPMGVPGHEIYWIADVRQQGALLKVQPQPVVLDEASAARLATMDGVYVTAFLPVRGPTNVRDLRIALSRLVTSNNIGSVTELSDSSGLIVTDFAPTLAAIYRLVQQMEAAQGAVGSGGRSVRSVQLVHARAEELAPLLARAFLVPTAVQQPNVPPTAPGGPSVQAEPRTNQLLVTGTQAEIEAVLATLRTLDVPTAAAAVIPTQTETVRLTYARAQELANILQNMAGNSRQLWAGSPDGSARPIFAADPRSNALVIVATARALEEIKRVVATLDVAPEPAATGK